MEFQGIPVEVNPYCPTGTVWLINKLAEAKIACRTLDELIEWMARNGYLSEIRNIGENNDQRGM